MGFYSILIVFASGILILILFLLVLTVYLVVKNRKETERKITEISKTVEALEKQSREEMYGRFDSMSRMLMSSLGGSFDRQDARLEALSTEIGRNTGVLDERFKAFSQQSLQSLDSMRGAISSGLGAIRDDNIARLNEIKETVDEKLQKTLNERISQSFKLVSDRLEQVYKGLGEMQNLAAGVGDLKKTLSNVKTRGILGEMQLGAILEQMMSPEQYDTNIATKKGSSERVEFAVKLPGDDGGTVYLPIDSKFPLDAYSAVNDAYNAGDPNELKKARMLLVQRIRSFAQDIKAKYIDPPATTDFALMFLPVEGLYAEAVNMGLVEMLQRDYKVSISGPTTTAAFLSSLQMGFRTLAIQKRSSEVWRVLGEVRTEFDSFEKILASAQQRINQANDDLDKLIGIRTRQIQRKLKDVTTLPGDGEEL